MKKVLVLLALLAAVCGLLTFSAAAKSAAASGICGENLTWTLDAAGTLTVSGTGAMKDCYYKLTPWYQSRSSIKAVVIESGVTSIGEYAFCDCDSLTSITIPEGVTTIGDGAFYSCESLTGITIPESVTAIGGSAFSGCFSLTDVSITDLDAWCRIDFADGSATPTLYAKNIWLDGQKLVSVTVPEGVTEVKAYTFCGFKDLIQVTIPEGVTTIGDRAFSGCSSLTSITIPEGVTTIGDRAFDGCRSLTSINIPESVTAIGSSAFSGCNSLTSITIPESVTTIGDYAFYGCSSLTDVSITDLDAWCRIDFTGFLATPMGYAKNIWLDGRRIVSVAMPEGITEVKAYTFYGFKDLIQVIIPEGVTAIGYSAFWGCSSLSSITLPEGVTTIGSGAFADCSSLTSINIPEGVTAIGDFAFADCRSLSSITIPEGVTTIGEEAFTGCISLSSITIPESVTTIGDFAFSGCTGLTSINIPESVTSIGKYAFADCSSLTSINIPEGVTAIGEAAFLRCSSLISINIPESVTVIQKSLFDQASGLRRVALPKGLKGVAANAFYGCTKIQEVFYAGSETEWNALPIATGNDPLKNATIYYNSTLDDYYCRITVEVSEGGRVAVSANTVMAGDTVTVTATPYRGYVMSAIYVDGAEISGDTFTVTGNHRVSAVFTRLPIVGGNEDFRLEGITVLDGAGNPLQELPAERLLVTVTVRHLKESGGGTVMLAQYDERGRYQGLLWLTLEEMPQGMTLKVTLPVDNTGGSIAQLKVFLVESLLSPAPVGEAISFGTI